MIYFVRALKSHTNMHGLDVCMKFMIYSIETVQLAGLSQVNKRQVILV